MGSRRLQAENPEEEKEEEQIHENRRPRSSSSSRSPYRSADDDVDEDVKNTSGYIIGKAVNTAITRGPKSPVLRGALRSFGNVTKSMAGATAVLAGIAGGMAVIGLSAVAAIGGAISLLASYRPEGEPLNEETKQSYRVALRKLTSLYERLQKNVEQRDKLFQRIEKQISKSTDPSKDAKIKSTADQITKKTIDQIKIGSEMIKIMNNHGEKIIDTVHSTAKSKNKANDYLDAMVGSAKMAAKGALTTKEDLANKKLSENASLDIDDIFITEIVNTKDKDMGTDIKEESGDDKKVAGDIIGKAVKDAVAKGPKPSLLRGTLRKFGKVAKWTGVAAGGLAAYAGVTAAIGLAALGALGSAINLMASYRPDEEEGGESLNEETRSKQKAAMKRLKKLYDQLQKNLKERDKLFDETERAVSKFASASRAYNDPKINKLTSQITKKTVEQITIGSQMIELMNDHGDDIVEAIRANAKSSSKADEYIDMMVGSAKIAAKGGLTSKEEYASKKLSENTHFDAEEDFISINEEHTEDKYNINIFECVADILKKESEMNKEELKKELNRRMESALQSRKESIVSKVYDNEK